MADEASTIDAALKELASLGRRIAELASTFESRRAGGGAVAERPADDGPADAAAVSESATAADAAPPGASERAAGSAGQRPPLPRRRPRTAAAAGSRRASVVAGDERPPGAAARAASSQARRQTPAARGRTTRRRALPWPWHVRPTAPMLVSTGLHTAALVVLALVFVVRETPPPRLSITLPAGEEEPLEELAEVDIEPLDVEPTDPLDPAAVLPDLAALMPVPRTG